MRQMLFVHESGTRDVQSEETMESVSAAVRRVLRVVLAVFVSEVCVKLGVIVERNAVMAVWWPQSQDMPAGLPGRPCLEICSTRLPMKASRADGPLRGIRTPSSVWSRACWLRGRWGWA